VFRTVAIVQARMGSRRLSGKVLALLGGPPVLWHVTSRVAQARTVDEGVVATSDQPGDDPIAGWCAAEGLTCVRGPEADVLARYALAGEATGADVVVRVTADCPLLSPAVLDLVVDARSTSGADYASNTLARGFPHGLDVECLTRAALDAAAAEALDPEEREHVTPFVYNRPERFRLSSVAALEDWSWLRWTLDTEQDLQALEAIVAAFPSALDPLSDWRALAEQVAASPALRAANDTARAATDAVSAHIRLH
jgi:spore coat polysaccharide biosynthesis protein SpsF (cytidylyltransferase family)